LATLAAFATLGYASPIEQRAALDVFAPPITSPVAGDVWVVGETKNVTWDVSHAPTQITNPEGTILLRKGNLTTTDILATGFDIRDGSVEVTVPDVEDDDDYSVVLFGDSGNWSPDFNITHKAN
ncbi:hypothetical protein K435DRAFT_686022, partial [Dendrothele bispora CBS 962.96]